MAMTRRSNCLKLVVRRLWSNNIVNSRSTIQSIWPRIRRKMMMMMMD